MSERRAEIAKIFKAFGDETRLMALELLQSGEKCACALLAKVFVGQSTLSHHMKILVESGIVRARKVGKWTYYSINQEASAKAIKTLIEITEVAVTKEGEALNALCQEPDWESPPRGGLSESEKAGPRRGRSRPKQGKAGHSRLGGIFERPYRPPPKRPALKPKGGPKKGA
jgi:ArsR family transcriptional regulator